MLEYGWDKSDVVESLDIVECMLVMKYLPNLFIQNAWDIRRGGRFGRDWSFLRSERHDGTDSERPRDGKWTNA